MSQPPILITNARLVNEGAVTEGDLLVREGRIARVGGAIAAPAGAEVIDAAGRLLLPGMIDDQVHFREPGLTHKGELATESRAAVAGGITSFMDMPNTQPQTTTVEELERKYASAAGRSAGNYAFYMGATNDNLEEIRALRPDQTCGIKVFMGSSTGNMLVDREETLDGIFRDAPMIVATHCEDTPTIEANEARARAEYGEAVPFRLHPVIRSAEACLLSSSFAVGLARRHGTRLHVLHITSAAELDQFEPGAFAVTPKRITAEVCAHHLYFDDGDYEARGAAIKCNPAIKTRADRDALRRALLEGRLDVIGTDHAPHTLEEKGRGYFQAPSGLPLVQHALPLLFELHLDGVLPLETLVERACHAPARLFDVAERGFLREGYWADLVIADLNAPQEVRREEVLYKCGWSPLEGLRMRSSITHTLVNGVVAVRDGRVTEARAGQRLGFARG